MKNKSEKVGYNKYKDMALFLLGHKVFGDYLKASKICNTEPERFFEEWMKWSAFQMDDEIQKWTWRYFITTLINYRKTHKI